MNLSSHFVCRTIQLRLLNFSSCCGYWFYLHVCKLKFSKQKINSNAQHDQWLRVKSIWTFAFVRDRRGGLLDVCVCELKWNKFGNGIGALGWFYICEECGTGDM